MQNWKCPTIPTIEECLEKMLDLAEMAKITALVRGMTICLLRTGWKLIIGFF